MSRIGSALRSFGRFWLDFLIGDTPEVFVAVLVLVAIAYGLHHDRVAAVIVLPVLAATVLAASAWRGRKRAGAEEGPKAAEEAHPDEP